MDGATFSVLVVALFVLCALLEVCKACVAEHRRRTTRIVPETPSAYGSATVCTPAHGDAIDEKNAPIPSYDDALARSDNSV